MIVAHLYDTYIETDIDDIRYAVDIEHLSPSEQVQLDCWSDKNKFMCAFLQALLQAHGKWGRYEVVKNGVVVYESPNRDSGDLHPDYQNPCPECRKKIEEYMINEEPEGGSLW